MSSYRQILYHLVFRTKNSQKTIVPAHSKDLYRINGMEDHIHILCDLHPSLALADYMRDLKTSSSIWTKQSGKFPDFKGWADGYAALTYGWKDKDIIANYIKNQSEHHKNESFENELRRLLEEYGIDVDERYFP
jgi:REP element-mobilizing transposase RayT